jgi:hypothetical protein
MVEVILIKKHKSKNICKSSNPGTMLFFHISITKTKCDKKNFWFYLSVPEKIGIFMNPQDI